MKAMLLAAGLGNRFRPHTEVLAKPAIPFLNLPTFCYSLYHLEKAGLESVIVNTHHLPKTIAGGLESYTEGAKYKHELIHEDKEILGSGGGIANAKKFFSDVDHFFVINADVIFLLQSGYNLLKMWHAHVSTGALCTMLTAEHEEAGLSMGGVNVQSDGLITDLGIRQRTSNTKHFAGVFLFSKRIFDFMPNKKVFHIFEDCLTAARSRGEKIMSYHAPDLLWLDVTDEKSYLQSTSKALRHLWGKSAYGQELMQIFNHYKKEYHSRGPNIWLGSRAEIECDVSSEALVLAGEGALIRKPVGIKGFAVFGPNVIFDQGFIENSVIAPGVHMHELFAIREQLLLQKIPSSPK